MSFDNLGLSPALLKAITAQGYDKPSPIQEQGIPPILQGKDIMAAAQTGTGKTAAFTLPLLQNLSKGANAKSNHVRALVLTPTRELAAQVEQSVVNYGKNLNLRSTVVFGGVKINPQMMRLRKGCDILVATPGRLLDLYNQNAIKFNQLQVLVLDEADRMLDMGFIHDIRKIMALLPKQRQNLLFSATFSPDIRKLAKGIVRNPVEISVSPPNAAANTVKQWLCPVDKKRKPALLSHLIKEHEWQQVLVFARTKHGANKLTKFLEDDGIRAAAIHGNKSQAARTKALAEFKQYKTRVLVATDIAARGIDIQQLPQVVNVDLPNVPEDYVHRIGRTGRAGETGQAVSLVSADEIQQLNDIERLIKKTLKREIIDGFEPEHDVPPSGTKPKKSGKPTKKPAAANKKRKPRRGAPAEGNKGKPRKKSGSKAAESEGFKPRKKKQRSRAQPKSSSGNTKPKSDSPYGKAKTRKPK